MTTVTLPDNPKMATATSSRNVAARGRRGLEAELAKEHGQVASRHFRTWAVAILALAFALSSCGLAHSGAARRLPRGTSAQPSVMSELLSAVSCPGRGRCVAVGSSGKETLVLVEQGGRWLPLPGEVKGSLRSVSCPVEGWCLAVGSGPGEHALVMRIEESRLARAAFPDPRGLSEASSVSCVAVGRCVVSEYSMSSSSTETRSSILALAEGHWRAVWTSLHIGVDDLFCRRLDCIGVGTSGASAVSISGLTGALVLTLGAGHV